MKTLLTAIIALACMAANADNGNIVEESIFTDSYRLKSEKAGTLSLSIDNTSFLKDNNNDGDILPGYTMSGFRLAPRLIWQPASTIKIEGGLSMLKFFGANRYPNYAYSNIAEWKADSYQAGFHLLPFFRAQIQPAPQLNIIFGNLYGGSNHNIIEPLYNREQNFSADKETGTQLIYNPKIMHLDAWVNWETFAFKNENRNEALSVGVSSCFHITNPEAQLYFGIPIQTLICHSGGEIDAIKGTNITQTNSAAGVKTILHPNRKWIQAVEINILLAAYRQLNVSDTKNGKAICTTLNVRIKNVNLKLNFWRSEDFTNLFGHPLFGNISLEHEDWKYPKTTVFNPGIKYESSIAKGCYLGAEADLFYNPEATAFIDGTDFVKQYTSGSWSAGLYLRINPEIILKK
ncbi:MAG: hypothetical protein LBJ17_05795 [Dysgonamonadaceae bacterium]|jgi:hypothetical protein|nr:hypothetical protein [Dysgonamonadaceae bacterium]